MIERTMSLDTNQDRLHWKVLHEGNFSDEFDFLESLLIADGVPQENIPKLLNPTADLTHDPFLMVNMDKAIEMVHEVVKKNGRIFVLPDNDCDGMTSSSAIIQFLKAINPELTIKYKLTYDKSHGLKFENLMGYTKDEFDLFIVPDASMECSDARQITKNFSAKILVLDHHLVSTEYLDTKTGKWITKVEADKIRDKRPNQIEEDVYTNYCVAVNCHDGQYPNPDLSGVGVVQKFIEAYLERYAEEDKLDLGLREQFLDLVSLGLCADSIDSRSLEARYYMIEGLKTKHLKNGFIKELMARNEDDFKFGSSLHTNGWVLGPKINGVIRYGKPEEIEEVYEALLGSTEMVEYQPRRKSRNDPKPPVETHTIQWDAARICENVKSRQDTAVRKGMRELKEIIEYSAGFLEKDKDGKIKFIDRWITPKPMLYHFDLFYPVKYEADLSKPVGQRLTKVTLDGKDLEDDKVYKLAVNNYRALGGGFYPAYSMDKIEKIFDQDYVQMFSEYLTHDDIKVDTSKNYKFY